MLRSNDSRRDRRRNGELVHSCETQQQWGPGTPRSSAFRNPLPTSPCVGEERRAWSGLKSPYRRYCGQHTLLQGMGRTSRTPCHRARLRPRYGAAMSAPSGANTAPHHTYVVGGPLKTTSVSPCTGLVVPTKPPHRVFRTTACLPPLPRPLVSAFSAVFD